MIYVIVDFMKRAREQQKNSAVLEARSLLREIRSMEFEDEDKAVSSTTKEKNNHSEQERQAAKLAAEHLLGNTLSNSKTNAKDKVVNAKTKEDNPWLQPSQANALHTQIDVIQKSSLKKENATQVTAVPAKESKKKKNSVQANDSSNLGDNNASEETKQVVLPAKEAKKKSIQKNNGAHIIDAHDSTSKVTQQTEKVDSKNVESNKKKSLSDPKSQVCILKYTC